MPYLGFIPAAGAPIVAASGPFAPITLGLMAIGSALPFLKNIGAGRNEADQIVPEQNKFQHEVLETVQSYLAQPLTVAELQQLHDELWQEWQSFYQFVYQDRFTADGDRRASDGAIATLEPYVKDFLTQIETRITATGGQVRPPVLTQTNYPTLQYPAPGSPLVPQAGRISLKPGQPDPGLALNFGSALNSPVLWPVLALAGAALYWRRQL